MKNWLLVRLSQLLVQSLQSSADKVMEGGAGIWSFKLLSLTIGELDFSADDGFLEAILSFIVSIPTADIWQVGWPRVSCQPVHSSVHMNHRWHTLSHGLCSCF